MRVRRMTEEAGSPIIASSTSERTIAVDWTPGFIIEENLGFIVGDQVMITPVPWAGALMGGRVASANGPLLEVSVDSAIGEGTFSNWEIVRFGGPGDWRFGGGRGDFYQDQVEGVVQIVLTSLRLYRGEWFIDTSKGMPWYEAVLGKHTRQAIEPAIRAEILGVPGVTRIKTFQLTIDPDTRVASIAAEIDTEFGPTIVQGVL